MSASKSTQDFYPTCSLSKEGSPTRGSLPPAERAAIRDFVQGRWKEVVMMEAEKRHSLLIRSQYAAKKSLTASPRKLVDKLNQTQSLRFLRSPTQKLTGSPRPVAFSPTPSLTKSMWTNLDSQVQSRRAAASRVEERIAAEQIRMRKAQERALREFSQAERALARIAQKGTEEYHKPDSGNGVQPLERSAVPEDPCCHENRPILYRWLFKHARIVRRVLDKVQVRNEARRVEEEEKYVRKTQRIERTKSQKLAHIKQLTEQRIKSGLAQKQRQGDMLTKVKEVQREQWEALTEQVAKTLSRKKRQSMVSFRLEINNGIESERGGRTGVHQGAAAPQSRTPAGKRHAGPAHQGAQEKPNNTGTSGAEG